jgi:hypothetical protein
MTAEKKETTPIDEKPPFFKNWKQLYVFVLAVFATLVFLFYLFTLNFS